MGVGYPLLFTKEYLWVILLHLLLLCHAPPFTVYDLNTLEIIFLNFIISFQLNKFNNTFTKKVKLISLLLIKLMVHFDCFSSKGIH